MELWIRSQDKEKLLKVNDIAIENKVFLETKEISMIYGYFDKNTEYEHLGTYKSKERALEVLDEIQNKIAQNQALISLIPKANDLKGHEEKISKFFKDMIYEMPEE